MPKKILKPISSKKLYKRKNSVVWLQVPTNYTSQAERDQVMEATMDMLEQIIYKN
jgi:hypothetical protein